MWRKKLTSSGGLNDGSMCPTADGNVRWQCDSTRPGMTVAPAQSTTWSPTSTGVPPPARTLSMWSPRTTTSAGTGDAPVPSKTRPPVNRIRFWLMAVCLLTARGLVPVNGAAGEADNWPSIQWHECGPVRPPMTRLWAIPAFTHRTEQESAMDVGLGPTIRYHKDRPRPLAEVYDEFLDEFILGEELGYSHIWLPEHHFAYDAHNPSALPILAALARQTTRIRLGTYILLLAFHHPILVAEDAAVLDILSHGRLDLAIGAGPMVQESEVFGIAAKETFGRTYEALEVIQKCWTEERFSHHGRYFDFDDVEVTTKPVQQPHPP